MSIARVRPVTGTERERQWNQAHAVGANLMQPSELHTTSDQHRLFLGHLLVSGSRWLGSVATEAAMLGLGASSESGCWPLDFCYRSDIGATFICTSNNGALLSDWFELQVRANWGSVLGNISDQADLASALAGKANSAHSHGIGDITGLVSALADKADASALATVASAVAAIAAGKEDNLGVPDTNGKVLSSTVSGVRSWVLMSGGGGGGSGDAATVGGLIYLHRNYL